MSGIFKPLQAEDIECRVAQVNKDNSVNVLLYKTARTDMKYLDEAFGMDGWQCDYKEINGVVYCGIAFWSDAREQWIWKWDAGAESNVEKEKGQASDALKRACFRIGLGRELYSAPKIRIKADKAGVKDGKCFTPFEVDTIEYDAEGKITKLIIKHAWNDEILYQWYASEPNNAPDRWDAGIKTPASAKQVDYIKKLFGDDIQGMRDICARYEVKKLQELTSAQANEVIKERTGK